MKWLILFGLLALAGCVRRPAPPTQADIDEADNAQCQSYGLTYGTEAYAQCREQIAGERQEANDQRRAQVQGLLLQHMLGAQ